MPRNVRGRLTPEQAFGKVLREVRQKQGMSQEALGFESGYHRTYIGMLERGLMNPTLQTILSVTTALEIPPGELVQRVSACLGENWKKGKEAPETKATVKR